MDARAPRASAHRFLFLRATLLGVALHGQICAPTGWGGATALPEARASLYVCALAEPAICPAQSTGLANVCNRQN